MIHGLMPRSKRCMVPPMQKPCPLIDDKPSSHHISLQRSRNQDHFRGDHNPSAVSKAKSGVLGGRIMFEAQ